MRQRWSHPKESRSSIAPSAFTPTDYNWSLNAIISIDFESPQDFTTMFGSVAGLAAKIVPTLTGLGPTELRELGYALIEEGTHKALVFVPPGDLAQTGGNHSSTSPAGSKG